MLFDGNSRRYIASKNVELTFQKVYGKKKKKEKKITRNVRTNLWRIY